VILSGEDSKGNQMSDYINANYVDGITPKFYVATQGPLIETSKDFWRMVWEVDSGIVVMLTKTIENGRIKCTRYWPEEGEAEPPDTGDFKLTLISDEENDKLGITTRKFRFSKKGQKHKREIIQIQYHQWPDQGVPEETKGVRQVVKMVDRNRRKISLKGPIIVHCSAGIGRSGAFMAIHYTLHKVRKHIRSESTEPFQFNIYETVVQLRKQRTGMVQQPEQYRFCYEAIVRGSEKLGLIFDDEHGNYIREDHKEWVDQRKERLRRQKSERTESKRLLLSSKQGIEQPNTETDNTKKKEEKYAEEED